MALSFYRPLLQACYQVNIILWRWILLGLGPVALTGFAVCARAFARVNLDTQDKIAIRFLLQIRMSWLRALSRGCRCWCWCCGPGRWCCELAERVQDGRRRWSGAGAAASVVSWQSAPVLVSAGCAGFAHSCSSQSYVNISWDSA